MSCLRGPRRVPQLLNVSNYPDQQVWNSRMPPDRTHDTDKGPALPAPGDGAAAKDVSLDLDPAIIRVILDHAGDGVVLQDERAIIEWANPSYCRMMGYALDEIRGRNPLEYCMPPEATPTAEEIAAFRYDTPGAEHPELVIHRNRRRSGELFWMQISHSRVPASDTRAARYILICRDVTEQVEQRNALEDTKRKLAEAAETDMLTGLLNREGLYRNLEDLQAHPDGAGPLVGLLHIDLDRFKAVNDTHGHSAGDSVLYAAAARMRRAAGRGDLIARIGGDEFIIVRPGARDLDELEDLARSLRSALGEPVDWADRLLPCDASIGIAAVETGALKPEELVADADFALYRAKGAGRGGVRSYTSDLRQLKEDQHQLGADIQGAMTERSFEPYFQPIVDLVNYRVVGFEMLVRWNHPHRGLLLPGQFLPLVSDLSLSLDLDRIMLRRGLDAQRSLHRQTGQDLIINLNTHPDSLGHPGHVDEILWEVDRRDMSPDRLMIEVLETTQLSDDDDPTARSIARLADNGVRVALDDYGVGYAGMANLTIPGLDCIKIDRSLIRDARYGNRSEIILRAIVRLGRDLGYSLVAEGVETVEDALRLLGLGFSRLQGYWIARPMPFDTAVAWLKTEPMTEIYRQVNRTDSGHTTG